MAYFTVWLNATIIGIPKERRTGKRGDTVQFLDIQKRMEKDVLDPAALDTDGFYGGMTEPKVAALWIEKICRATFMIKNVEANGINDIEDAVNTIFNATKNSSKVDDIFIIEVKRQEDFE